MIEAIANKPWAGSEIEQLKALYGVEPFATIAAMLGRSVTAVKAAAGRFKIARSRAFSQADIDFIRRNTPGMTAKQIGAALGRPETSIFGARMRLRLTRKQPSFGEDFRGFLLEKHAAGWSDREIAEAWGCDRHTIGDHRKRLGLADNALSEHRIELVRQATKRQLDAAGLKSLADVRVKAYRDRAQALGWPDDLAARAVEILEALYQHGPMTKRQIAEKLGLPASFRFHDNTTENSYLGSLLNRGFIVSLGRCVYNGAQSKNTVLYSTPLFLERGKIQRVKE